jgi:hypothetical protein
MLFASKSVACRMAGAQKSAGLPGQSSGDAQNRRRLGTGGFLLFGQKLSVSD